MKPLKWQFNCEPWPIISYENKKIHMDIQKQVWPKWKYQVFNIISKPIRETLEEKIVNNINTYV